MSVVVLAFAGQTRTVEPIVSTVDVHFTPPGLETVPAGDPHSGDLVKIVAHVGLDGKQVWTKRGVVLDKGTPGNPDSQGATAPSVLYADGEYKMWYAGADAPWPTSRILYANSSNGVAWKKHGVVLDFGGSGEDYSVHYPFVMKDGGTYKMWYSGYDKPDLGGHWRIFYATSSDGVTWTKYGLVLDIGAPGSYDDVYVYNPFVLLDGTYKMWYAGRHGANVRLMYTVSSNGVNWTKQGVALDLGAPGSKEDVHVSSCYILKEGGAYHMWYRGSDGSHDRVFYANSQDGLVWKSRRLVLDIGLPGATDSTHVVYQSVLHLAGDTYQMWYGGRDGAGVDRIHYADLTSFPLPANVDVSFYLDVISPGSKLGSATVVVSALSPTTGEVDWVAGPPGNHVIYAVIDPANEITEWDETNNTASLSLKVIGFPPIADAGPDVTILEGQAVTLDGSGSYDPDGTIVNYTWDLDVTVDSNGDGNPTNDVDAWTPAVSRTYGDDGVYCALLTVTDNEGMKASDTACVNVTNIAPTASVHSLWSDVKVMLRVAGRKWNSVSMELHENDSLVANVTVTRMPGSPDDQSAAVSASLNMLASHSAVVRYFPNETVNGGIGGNPVWIILSTGVNETRLHHTFNVQQSIKRNSTHWNHVEPWLVNINAAMVGLKMKADVEASDLGSDDIILEWSTGEKYMFYNNGISPDPPHSPDGVFPFAVRTSVDLTYCGSGTLTLEVSDDDGGASGAMLELG